MSSDNQSGNDEDDDFLAMTGGGSPSSGVLPQTQLPADDISVDEWWSTTFMRLSLRVWFWIGIGLFITFVLTVITIEVMKAYEAGPFKNDTPSITASPD